MEFTKFISAQLQFLLWSNKVWENQTIWISPWKVKTNEFTNASKYILQADTSQAKKLFTRNKDLFNLLSDLILKDDRFFSSKLWCKGISIF